MEWSIAEGGSVPLKDHLHNLKRDLEEYDFGRIELYDFYDHKLPSEAVMKNLTNAAKRIIKAARESEKIIIFGHDDLDGITSTYILFDFLSQIGSQNHFYYIPNRLQEHHGIQDKFIERVKEGKFSLVITVDGGISSREGVDKLNELGCKTIITDHHIVPEELPDAEFIVNPKQPDCPYPYDMLAGVGVTFFLVKRMADLLETELPDHYLLWTMIGSIADKAPMTGVNRILCKVALERWFKIEDETLMICPNYNFVRDDYFSKMGFITSVIKLFNNGRDEGGENLALYLLLAPVYKKRELIASLLPKKNEYESNLYHVKRMIDKQLPEEERLHYIYIDDNDEIPYVFLGWAANYITYLFKIPVLMLKKSNGNYLCEARCTEGFDLVSAFDYASESLDQYGGHIRAAGFLTSEDKISKFKEKFLEYIDKHEDSIRENRVIRVDAIVDESDLHELPKIVSSFAPFGESASEPVFLIRNYRIEKLLDSNCHISFKEYQAGCNYDIVFTYRFDGKYQILDFKEPEGHADGTEAAPKIEK